MYFPRLQYLNLRIFRLKRVKSTSVVTHLGCWIPAFESEMVDIYIKYTLSRVTDTCRVVQVWICFFRPVSHLHHINLTQYVATKIWDKLHTINNFIKKVTIKPIKKQTLTVQSCFTWYRYKYWSPTQWCSANPNFCLGQIHISMPKNASVVRKMLEWLQTCMKQMSFNLLLITWNINGDAEYFITKLGRK